MGRPAKYFMCNDGVERRKLEVTFAITHKEEDALNRIVKAKNKTLRKGEKPWTIELLLWVNSTYLDYGLWDEIEALDREEREINEDYIED